MIRRLWERFVSHGDLIRRPLNVVELDPETPAEFARRILK